MNYNLVFTPAQINVLDKALQQLPLGQALEVYLSIKSQIEKQDKTKQNNTGND